jgi:hypothetical protein
MDHDDLSDAMAYTMRQPVDPAALLAVVATTGLDLGLTVGLKVLGVIGVFGGLATVLGRSMGGWFTSTVLLAGMFLGVLYLLRCRRNQLAITHAIIERYGAARFVAAQGLVDQANRIIEEA